MDWTKIGEALGDALARGIKAVGLDEAIRGHYAEKYGRCRGCQAPLGGESPEQMCETCHAENLRAFGDRLSGKGT